MRHLILAIFLFTGCVTDDVDVQETSAEIDADDADLELPESTIECPPPPSLPGYVDTDDFVGDPTPGVETAEIPATIASPAERAIPLTR